MRVVSENLALVSRVGVGAQRLDAERRSPEVTEAFVEGVGRVAGRDPFGGITEETKALKVSGSPGLAGSSERAGVRADWPFSLSLSGKTWGSQNLPLDCDCGTLGKMVWVQERPEGQGQPLGSDEGAQQSSTNLPGVGRAHGPGQPRVVDAGGGSHRVSRRGKLALEAWKGLERRVELVVGQGWEMAQALEGR